jgi:hypothetical protein
MMPDFKSIGLISRRINQTVDSVTHFLIFKGKQQLRATALLILVCNTKHICFCHESALDLITSLLAAGALSRELTLAMDKDCDWHSSTSNFFCLF